MCNKRSSRTVRIAGKKFRVDACLQNLIYALNAHGIETLACCCGHGKYPMTIVYETDSNIHEFCTDAFLSTRKRFYKKDKQGLYYIPIEECIKVIGEK